MKTQGEPISLARPAKFEIIPIEVRDEGQGMLGKGRCEKGDDVVGSSLAAIV